MNERSAGFAKINEQEINGLVSEIVESRRIADLKKNVESLMRLYENAESMHGYIIRERFYEAVKKRDESYQRRTKGLKYNAVIIPPELAPVAMIPAYVKMDGNHYDFMESVNRFIDRCDEFIEPICPAVTDEEIRAVLSAAQRSFGMIDIIAPDFPLRISRFDNSHITTNSECGIINGGSRHSVVFLYHPRESETYDSVFICAHELGHALHFALTGDVDIAPDGFDRFNKSFSPEFATQKASQEGFADAAAIAILGSPNSRLKSHLPTDWCRMISPSFVRYFSGLCGAGRK